MNEAAELALRDIHAAPLPGFWPPAPGWWLLALLLVLTLVVVLHALYGRYRRYRQRRRLLQTLADLRRQDQDARALAAEVSILLKRLALSRFPASEVAALSGAHWLAFLDETGGGEQFRHGPGRVLADAPYAPAAKLDVDGLYNVAADWIKRNA